MKGVVLHRVGIFTRDDVVSQRLGFGRWNFFIGVTNGHASLTFPFPPCPWQEAQGMSRKIVRFHWL